MLRATRAPTNGMQSRSVSLLSSLPTVNYRLLNIILIDLKTKFKAVQREMSPEKRLFYAHVTCATVRIEEVFFSDSCF